MCQTNRQFSFILTKIGNGEQLDEMEITPSLVFVLWKKLKQDVLKKMSLIDTNGMPYQTIYVNNIYYMITTNTDVTDGLANSADGKLVQVEKNHEVLVKTKWLEFPDLPQQGGKLRPQKTIPPYFYKIAG
ncbi:hypothetical protein TNCV_1798951 [Trichonephila clavipes]|uniref:Uncharacterized protein n=1 Tax=Trichonephila clavipes TaxID=2585209 RepID=A0A8X6VLM1_TRICX|nr:hypothetical protein TNCV_1798951 [Trichonephila clavipes]